MLAWQMFVFFSLLYCSVVHWGMGGYTNCIAVFIFFGIFGFFVCT
jgi:hypothetical protein